jgi:hypothetical protein
VRVGAFILPDIGRVLSNQLHVAQDGMHDSRYDPHFPN